MYAPRQVERIANAARAAVEEYQAARRVVALFGAELRIPDPTATKAQVVLRDLYPKERLQRQVETRADSAGSLSQANGDGLDPLRERLGLLRPRDGDGGGAVGGGEGAPQGSVLPTGSNRVTLKDAAIGLALLLQVRGEGGVRAGWGRGESWVRAWAGCCSRAMHAPCTCCAPTPCAHSLCPLPVPTPCAHHSLWSDGCCSPSPTYLTISRSHDLTISLPHCLTISLSRYLTILLPHYLATSLSYYLTISPPHPGGLVAALPHRPDGPARPGARGCTQCGRRGESSVLSSLGVR